MAKERALTLEALRVMDAIDRRGSFAAAADELGRVPSALSYTMQKLEEELDVVLFDRSGHRTKFTNVGRMLLERGRVLLEAADKLTTDAEALSRGWETHLTIVTEALVPTPDLFPLIEKLATKSNTQLSIITEVLAGAWERLEQGRADIVVAPDMHFRSSSEINSQALLETLDSATHVADVVTAPVMTPLLTFAAARGCRVQTGPEMALAQMTLMGQFIGAIPSAQGAAA